MKRTRYSERQLKEREKELKRSARYNERAGKEDWLSNLPDCVILEIMSYISTKQAVQTCILGKRWKDLWKSLPSLRLYSGDFSRIILFNRFMSRVLTRRNNSISLHSLVLMHNGIVAAPILNKVIKYAVSHQVQKLKMCFSISYEKEYREFPPSLFSCKNSLTSLDLLVQNRGARKPLLPKSLNMPSLAILRLQNFTFCKSDNMDCAEPFSNCNKLKTLEIKDCAVKDKKSLCISNATLANLTIHIDPYHLVEPYEIELSTPNLSSFAFMGCPTVSLTGCNLSFLEQVDIGTRNCCCFPPLAGASMLISWLKVLANVTSMTFSLPTLQVLSTLLRKPDSQPPCFGNLKILKVKLPTPYGVVDYLLRNSPSAEVTIIKY